MKRKIYQKPMMHRIEVLSQNLVAASFQGSVPTENIEQGTDIEFETKKNSDTQWSDMW